MDTALKRILSCVMVIAMNGTVCCAVGNAHLRCGDTGPTVAGVAALRVQDWTQISRKRVADLWPRQLQSSTVSATSEHAGGMALQSLHAIRGGECACCDTFIFEVNEGREQLQAIVLFRVTRNKEEAVALANDLVEAARPLDQSNEEGLRDSDESAAGNSKKNFRWFDRHRNCGSAIDTDVKAIGEGWRVYVHISRVSLD